jgi:hypothetical protein
MSPKRLSIFDIATMYEGEQDSATAYNEQGEKIDSMKGYFLEPHVNYDSAKIANSDNTRNKFKITQ